MNRSISFIFLLGIVTLAIIGLGSRLINDPVGLLTSILMFAAVLGIIVFVVKKFTSSPSQNAYKKAAKQSKKLKQQKQTRKSKQANVINYTSAHPKKTLKHGKRSDTHLTVIEGKKGKKKNQA